MNEKIFCVITFPSTHLALKWEGLAKKERINVKIIPVPRQISSSCGLAGRFSCEEKKEVLDLCEKEKIEIENIYSFSGDKNCKPRVVK